ncbi:Iq calmodulin-binding motif-containing protein 1-like [Plakobranchus ocellatus]|uniref:Iq calmodulin-binding motif-containing protein 1-like n=1 Tax=Plakobranchus ocellatus TaxID=259542 RepID=A0AAV3YVD8_9GAST|nr:Iq calmodulin-binding motif-containing protein 1-like [Plakobranchus ocellatus]
MSADGAVDSHLNSSLTACANYTGTCGLALSNPSDLRQLDEDHLPKCVENLLILARHINAAVTALPKDSIQQKSQLVASLKQVMDALVQLAAGYFYICTKVMSSPWLLQLLVSDDPKITNIIMATMEKLLRLDPQLLSKIDEETVFSLMDELVYKLTVNTDVMIAAGACRCLLRFCDYHKPLVEALCSRYKGLRPLLRRWEGRGLDRDLRHMGLLLESGSALRAKAQRNHECARYIQAVWRGYAARRRLRKADKAFAKFQKSYRLKRAEQEQVKLATQFQSELYHQMKMKRQKMLRAFNEKRLQTMEILPAARIEEYLRKEKSVAALRIQTLWRGHRERSKLSERQKIAQQVKAAIRIQRAFRRWLEKTELARQEFPTHLKPPGLTDARRVELMKTISKWREQHPPLEIDEAELQSLHKRTHEALAAHYSRVRPYRKLQYQVEGMVARIDTDTELLALAPPLKDVTEKDVAMYSSRSLPVAIAAKERHAKTLRMRQLPWWKILGEEEEDPEDVKEGKEQLEAELLLEAMGI